MGVHLQGLRKRDLFNPQITGFDGRLDEFLALPVAGDNDGPPTVRRFTLILPAVSDGDVREFGSDVGADVAPIDVEEETEVVERVFADRVGAAILQRHLEIARPRPFSISDGFNLAVVRNSEPLEQLRRRAEVEGVAAVETNRVFELLCPSWPNAPELLDTVDLAGEAYVGQPLPVVRDVSDTHLAGDDVFALCCLTNVGFGFDDTRSELVGSVVFLG